MDRGHAGAHVLVQQGRAGALRADPRRPRPARAGRAGGEILAGVCGKWKASNHGASRLDPPGRRGFVSVLLEGPRSRQPRPPRLGADDAALGGLPRLVAGGFILLLSLPVDRVPGGRTDSPYRWALSRPLLR